MGFVKREIKEKIIQLMLKEVPTEEIANRLNYSVGTIRKVFEELRDEYGATSKMGIAIAYLTHEILKSTEHILEITGYRNLTISGQPNLKPVRTRDRKQNFKNKKRFKN